MIQPTEKTNKIFWGFHAKMIELEALIETIDKLILGALRCTVPVSMLDAVLKKVSLLTALIQNKRYDNLKTRFPNALWASVFVTSFSSTERALDDLCKHLRDEKKITLSQSDLIGKGITRSHNYLSKVVNLDLSNQSKEWEFLKKSNAVRNCLTHADGIIEDIQEKENLKQIIKQDHTLSDVDGHLVISKQFVLNFIDVSKKFFPGITGITLPQ
jgi:hypothetical protein